MSHIPNSAIPHAQAQTEEPTAGESRLGQVAELIREHPKTAAAAGVAVAGIVAAAAIPAIRGRASRSGGGNGSGKKSR